MDEGTIEGNGDKDRVPMVYTRELTLAAPLL